MTAKSAQYSETKTRDQQLQSRKEKKFTYLEEGDHHLYYGDLYSLRYRVWWMEKWLNKISLLQEC